MEKIIAETYATGGTNMSESTKWRAAGGSFPAMKNGFNIGAPAALRSVKWDHCKFTWRERSCCSISGGITTFLLQTSLYHLLWSRQPVTEHSDVPEDKRGLTWRRRASEPRRGSVSLSGCVPPACCPQRASSWWPSGQRWCPCPSPLPAGAKDRTWHVMTLLFNLLKADCYANLMLQMRRQMKHPLRVAFCFFN